MTTDRDLVFQNIRQALAARPAAARATLPEWEPTAVVCHPPRAFSSLVEHFTFKFEAAGGIVVAGLDALAAFLQSRGLQRGYRDPTIALPLPLETTFERARVDEYEFCITRATAAVAETGSLLLTAADTSCRLAALAPWVHVAILQHDDILPDLPAAIASLGNDHASLLVTGPSKTADVEGILIHGVHGPGVQVCCLI